MIQNGVLTELNIQLDGYKPIVYAEIPEFDESTQYVVQLEPVEETDNIYIGVEIKQLELTNEGDVFGEEQPI